eukprot:COSAG01_NODE_16078_length_1272_cov_1.953964_1_plen_175_part_00
MPLRGGAAAAKVVMAFVSEVTPRSVLHRGIDDDGTVSRAFPACTRSISTEIYLCHAGSCQEIEDIWKRPGQVAHPRAPNRALFGMQKVFLQPGESKTLTFSAPLVPAFDDWCVFCTVTSKGTRVIAPGVYKLSVGGHGGGADDASLSQGTAPASCDHDQNNAGLTIKIDYRLIG